MRKKNRFDKEFKNVQEETNSSAVLNDVINNEFEQYPGQNESLTDDRPLSPLQEVVQQNTDGKTWMTDNK